MYCTIQSNNVIVQKNELYVSEYQQYLVFWILQVALKEILDRVN